jgi:hypothetical protein
VFSSGRSRLANINTSVVPRRSATPPLRNVGEAVKARAAAGRAEIEATAAGLGSAAAALPAGVWTVTR